VNLQFLPGELALICGPTGSGKSTLLRTINGLAPHFTGGNLRGRIEVGSQDITGKMPHESAHLIGSVGQQPEHSFVADTVEDELAYGLEQMGVSPAQMSLRVRNIAEQFGLESLLTTPLANLSGGQKQRVSVGAAIAAGQRILLLDEPTSALDEVASAESIKMLRRLSKEQGITILIAEHRIDRLLEQVDSVVVVNGDASVSKTSSSAALRSNQWLASRHLERFSPESKPGTVVSLEVRDLKVVYPDSTALNSVSLKLHTGEILGVVGPNGSGKSTLLWAIQGSGHRTSGLVETKFGDPAKLKPAARLGLITLVPQEASDLLFLNTLGDELSESDHFAKVAPSTTARAFSALTGRVNPTLHPRDLSSGQQLALVLALQLVKDAAIVLLDEPTRGLDYAAKRHLVRQLLQLRGEGKSILIATHDREFLSQLADRIIVLKDGHLVGAT
jgi:energy-coupling factor transporter ATP-binding protein EcfA2